MHVAGLAGCQRGLDVDLRRREQGFAPALSAEGFHRRVQVAIRGQHQPAHQRIAVGVHAGGGHAHQHVALRHALAGDGFLPPDEADGEARQIVFALGVEIRHFSRLAADQRAARLTAAVRHARDNLLHLDRIEVARCDVIEENQRLRALTHHIVDAHRHAVDAHRVVLVHQERQLELGAHAVRARDEHRLFNVLVFDGIKAAERAEAAQHVFVKRGGDMLLHPAHGLVAALNVHTRVLIRNHVLPPSRASRPFPGRWGNRRQSNPCRIGSPNRPPS